MAEYICGQCGQPCGLISKGTTEIFYVGDQEVVEESLHDITDCCGYEGWDRVPEEDHQMLSRELERKEEVENMPQGLKDLEALLDKSGEDEAIDEFIVMATKDGQCKTMIRASPMTLFVLFRDLEEHVMKILGDPKSIEQALDEVLRRLGEDND